MPDFENIILKCASCGQDKADKYIRINTMDFSDLFESPVGTIFVNVKYCFDNLSCKLKASDREWVMKNYFKDKCK